MQHKGSNVENNSIGYIDPDLIRLSIKYTCMQKCIAHLLGDPPHTHPRVGVEGESYSPVVTLGFDERFYIIRNICCIHGLKKKKYF